MGKITPKPTSIVVYVTNNFIFCEKIVCKGERFEIKCKSSCVQITRQICYSLLPSGKKAFVD